MHLNYKIYITHYYPNELPTGLVSLSRDSHVTFILYMVLYLNYPTPILDSNQRLPSPDPQMVISIFFLAIVACLLSAVSGKLPEIYAFLKVKHEVYVTASTFYSDKCSFIFMSVHEVHIKCYFNVCSPKPKPPGFFGIKGNFINHHKIKSLFLFCFCSMKVAGLFKGYFLAFKCQ